MRGGEPGTVEALWGEKGGLVGVLLGGMRGGVGEMRDAENVRLAWADSWLVWVDRRLRRAVLGAGGGGGGG